jgi:opacity protein-like surface antigen
MHRFSRTTIVLLVLCTSTLLLPARADADEIWLLTPYEEAQQRHEFHAYFGGELFGLGAVRQQAGPTEGYLGRFGGGLGLYAGLRLNAFLSVEANWTFALHDENVDRDVALQIDRDHSRSIYVMTVSANAKLHLPTEHMIEPYVQVGGGLLMSGGIKLDERVSGDRGLSTGFIINAGVGADVWISRHLSVGARVLYRGMLLEPGSKTASPSGGKLGANFVNGISVDAMATIHF